MSDSFWTHNLEQYVLKYLTQFFLFWCKPTGIKAETLADLASINLFLIECAKTQSLKNRNVYRCKYLVRLYIHLQVAVK